ncbi:MAG: efflux RND transporter periplasmic adaptor subunit [Bacteroidales bacterium]|nr:efflux RND transporter periplasmic adaptor subunit [Bacteroidales bacterium]MDE5609110.1 efflux RND transporter periplasmic adaptor subunit [Bacteroidales bacterium]
MKRFFILSLSLGAALVAATGCGQKHPHEAHGDEAQKTQHKSNRVVFHDEQAQMTDFALEKVRLEKVGKLIVSAAQIQSTPGNDRDVIAKASGIVVFNQRDLTVGQEVKKDEKLFSLECGGMMENNIHQYYTETMNAYEQAQVEYQRKKELAEKKIVSESELLQAKTDYENALAKYRHLRKNFSGGRQIVNAPINGYIQQIEVKNGQFVQAGEPMLTVSTNRKLLLQADLPAKYHASLKHIMEVNIRQMNSSRTYSLEELHGRLVSYGKSVEKNNPLIPVIFEIDNAMDVLPGTFVNLYLKTGGENPRLSVANEAVVEDMGIYFVFVQVEPEIYEKREVVPGASDGFRTEILRGLHEGETVVSRGARILLLSQAASEVDPHAGHVH